MKTLARGSHPLGMAARRWGEARRVRGQPSDRDPSLRLLTPELSFPPPSLILSVPLDSLSLAKAGLSPSGCRLRAPRPTRGAGYCPGVLPPPGALWAAAGLVADAVVAAARLEGAAGVAQGVSARDRAAAAMGKGSGPRGTLVPASWAGGRGCTKRGAAAGAGHPGLPLGIRAGTRAWAGRGQPGTQGRPRSPW